MSWVIRTYDDKYIRTVFTIAKDGRDGATYINCSEVELDIRTTSSIVRSKKYATIEEAATASNKIDSVYSVKSIERYRPPQEALLC